MNVFPSEQLTEQCAGVIYEWCASTLEDEWWFEFSHTGFVVMIEDHAEARRFALRWSS